MMYTALEGELAPGTQTPHGIHHKQIVKHT